MGKSRYGLRGIYISELIDENAADVAQMYGTLIRLEGAKSFNLTNNYETISNEGDDQILESDSTLMSIDVEFEHAIMVPEAVALLEGCSVQDILDATTSTKLGTKLQLTKDSAPKYIGAIGFQKRSNGRKIALVKGKCLEGLSWSMVGKEFAVVSGKIQFIHRADGVIRNIFEHDIAEEPVVTDFE